MYQIAAVRQEEQAFAFRIESSGRVDIGGEGAEGGKRAVESQSSGELRKDVKGFEEEDNLQSVLLHRGMYDLELPETKWSRCFFQRKFLLSLHNHREMLA